MLKRKQISKIKKQKGQSTVEYIILVAAVLAALIIFLGPNGVFQGAMNDTWSTGTNSMVSMAERLEGSRGSEPVAPPPVPAP